MPRLYYVEDSELWGEQLRRHVPLDLWEYEWLKDPDNALMKLAGSFANGDFLILDIAFGRDREKGITLLREFLKKNPLDAKRWVCFFTAYDDEATREALRHKQLVHVPIVSKAMGASAVLSHVLSAGEKG